MKPRVHIETTIASAYHETRSDAVTVARRIWTRKWWDEKRADYDLFTSEAVMVELERGEYPHQVEAIEFLRELPVLSIESRVRDAAAEYIRQLVMPSDPQGDALHLAVASVHECDFLLTWNCRHLANANKYCHIQKINAALNLFVPMLITPLHLLPEESP